MVEHQAVSDRPSADAWLKAHPSEAKLVCVLSALRAADERSALSAARLAEMCRCDASNHEARKRGVRRLVERLRNGGIRICANLSQGYWLARSDTEWHAYCESRKRNAIFEFVFVRKIKQAAGQRSSGQRQLFDRDEPGSRGAWAKTHCME